MRVSVGYDGSVLIEGLPDELLDLAGDCVDAVGEGEPVVSALLNEDGVATFTVRTAR